MTFDELFGPQPEHALRELAAWVSVDTTKPPHMRRLAQEYLDSMEE